MDYKSKSNDSFKSRLRFYLFKLALTEDSIKQKDFIEFDIDEYPAKEFVDLYTTEYQQLDTTDEVSKYNKAELNNNGLYIKMKALEKDNKVKLDSWREVYFEEVFEGKLSKKKFEDFENKDHCGYCKTSIKTIRNLMASKRIFKKNERGYNLELDRKKPNKEYSTENCIMACYWCNNAKTDEFDDEEFMPIAKAIGKVFKKRENQ